MLPVVEAATFRTFLNDQAGMAAAMGPASLVTQESFAGVVDGQLLTATPDPWNTFTVELIGSGVGGFGASKYCSDLGSSSCINWNLATPRVPGIFGAFNGPGIGISIKLSSPTIAGFSFDFTDWNDFGERSYFEIVASDGSTVAVHGQAQPPNAPPQNFGVALSAADIAAGVYIQEIRWIGMPGEDEIVGFYHFATYTNPVLAPRPVQPVPTTSAGGLALLTVVITGMALYLRRRGTGH